MNTTLTERLGNAPIVPLVQADDPATAVATAEALHKGGLSVIEVVMRTPAALDCMREIIQSVPQVIVGAGTVLSAGQTREVLDVGAAFVVSPGLDQGVVSIAQAAGVPVYPGIATPSECQRAHNLGLDAVKFFPATLNGGVAMLKALGSVFRTIRFMPTGGISANNLAEYLALPSVLACGGSWLTPASEVAAGNFAAVTRLAEEALSIAAHARTK